MTREAKFFLYSFLLPTTLVVLELFTPGLAGMRPFSTVFVFFIGIIYVQAYQVLLIKLDKEMRD
jgi:hypothetical protein